MENEGKQLKRTMTPGQMEMIAIGGTIGSGLFMGATSTIKWAGPSVLLAYAFVGLVLYGVMRALGELVYLKPGTGSFADYGSEYIHPVAGYAVKWSNVFQFIIVGISDIIAMSQYLNYWWPNLPDWLSGIVMIAVLTLANLASAKSYARLEFWFAMIKVVTIIAMIIIGLLVICLGLGNNWHPVGISNLWSHGGFFPRGLKGFVFSMAVIAGSYQGIELLGITAGESASPRHAIIKSVRSVIYRILIFYIGAIFVIISIYPWNQLNAVGSPFVETFTKVGITGAAGIINFVVLTAALSGANSGIYSASRMLFKLSVDHEVSPFFSRLSKRVVPNVAILTIAFWIFVGFVVNFVLTNLSSASANLFVIVYSSSVLPGMVPWFVILLAELNYRKQRPQDLVDHPFKMPFFPAYNYFSLISLLIIAFFMFINPDTRVSISVGVVFLAIICGIYFLRHDKEGNLKVKKQAED